MKVSGGGHSGGRYGDGVPAELLRAGVYVPGTRETLEEAVRRARDEDEEGLDHALRARLSADPALLEEAVGRVVERIRDGAAEAVAVARPEDLVLAAPVAREARVPVRCVPGPGSGSAPGWPPPEGERCAGVSPVTPLEEIRDRVRKRLRRSGAVPAGWLAVAPAVSGAADGSWSATNPGERASET